jgi:carbon storage regulator
MLVLSRKPRESILIDDSIRVVVDEIRGGTVRLGIEAPRTVPIVRSELLDHPQQGKQRPARRPRPRYTVQDRCIYS